MPYLILAIGVIIGLYTLYRFFLNATVQEIKAFLLTAIAVILGLALFFMAITGRLPAALALLVALIPIINTLTKIKSGIKATAEDIQQESATMTREEALEILGLEETADEQTIKNAYKSLMRKVHPDNEGSDWMAVKLNTAKDTLLKKEEK